MKTTRGFEALLPVRAFAETLGFPWWIAGGWATDCSSVVSRALTAMWMCLFSNATRIDCAISGSMDHWCGATGRT